MEPFLLVASDVREANLALLEEDALLAGAAAAAFAAGGGR